MNLVESTKSVLQESIKQILAEGHIAKFPTNSADANFKGNIHTREISQTMTRLGYKDLSVSYFTGQSDSADGYVYGTKDGLRVTVNSFDYPQIRISVTQGSYGSDHDEATKSLKAGSAAIEALLENPGSILKPDTKHELIGATIMSVKPRGYDADHYLCQLKLTNGKTMNVEISEE